MNTSDSPLVINLERTLQGAQTPQFVLQDGPAPARIGSEMLAVPAGAPLHVEAMLTPLGEGVLVQAQVRGELEGQCVRCLRELHRPLDADVHAVFSAGDDLIQDEDGEEISAEDQADAAVYPIENEQINLEQLLIDEVGIRLPFNPTCEPECEQQGRDVPEPDGIAEEEDGVDPRWSGLEKFL